jgi:hypothetical protein
VTAAVLKAMPKTNSVQVVLILHDSILHAFDLMQLENLHHLSNEKRKSASPSAIQVKNRQKTIGTEDILHVISRLEKGEQIVDICLNVRLTHSSIYTTHDNADRIKESAKSGTKVFVCVARLPQSYPNEPYKKTMDVNLLNFIALEINTVKPQFNVPAFSEIPDLVMIFSCPNNSSI